MAVSSEIILAPRLDPQKMKKEAEKMEVTLRRSAKQSAEDFEYWFGKGFEKGAEKGGQKVKNKLRNLQGFLMLTGANLASEAVMAAAGVAKDIATKAFQGAEEYAQIARERLEGMSDLRDNADSLGIDRGRYAALSAVGISARLDQSDIRGILSGFVGALERPEMAAYKDAAERNGIENSFLDFIGTMSKMRPEMSAQYMNQVFGDEDALLASRFIKPFQEIIAKGGDLTFQNIMNTMLGARVRTGEMGDALSRSEEASRTLARGDANAFQKQIIDGITQSQAQNVVEADASEARRIQAHLDVLDLKVKGKILADSAEIKAIHAEQSIIQTSITYSAGFMKRFEELVEAGNAPVDEMKSWSVFMDKLIDFGFYSPVEAATGKSTVDHIVEYVDKRGGELNQMMVDIVEKEANNNKNRSDVGAHK